MSSFKRRSASVLSNNSSRRLMYDNEYRSFIDFVNLRCTASTLLMFPAVCPRGGQTGVQYYNNNTN